MTIEFKLKKYELLEEILCASFNNEITVDDIINDDGAGFIDDNGNELTINWKDQQEMYNKNGYWGFVDDKNVIHFWIAKDYSISMEDLLFFLGHEMGHKMEGGTKPNDNDYYDDYESHFKEESRADEYGYVARLAYKFSQQILEK